MEWVGNALRHHPELALFLALGYAIGKIQIGGFQIGAVIGTLIAGVVIGQIRPGLAFATRRSNTEFRGQT